MPDPKKTNMMRLLEKNHGKPIGTLLVDAYNTHGNVINAAKALGISTAVFNKWTKAFGVQIKPTATLATGKEG